MTEFIASLLWVAIGDAYDTRFPLGDAEFLAYRAAQDQLGLVMGWP